MPTTLVDIANELGVSKMTVSRAINNHPAINAETRERVLTIARRLNYRPNQYARALITNRSYLIGLIVPDLMHSYFAELAKAIESVARPAGYELLICTTEENAATELIEVEALRHRTDGLIIASAVSEGEGRAYRKMLREKTRIVMLDRHFATLPCPSVTTEDIEVGRLATGHLIRLGHRRIGHLRGSNVAVALNRLEGYRRALTQNRIRIDKSLIRPCGFFENDGYQAMKTWMAEGNLPTAIFATNDPAAIGALHALEEAGIRVPEEMAIIGAGNIHYADMLRTPLSTITWDKIRMGQLATRQLLSALEGKANGNSRNTRKHFLVPPQLVIRKSCGGEEPTSELGR